MSGSNARRIRAWAATLVAVIGTATMQANADTIYVNGTCGDNTWTGLSPVCEAPNGPKRTIQVGIDAAVNGDVVLIADGVYTGPGNKYLSFYGKSITVRSETDGTPASSTAKMKDVDLRFIPTKVPNPSWKA